MPGFFHAFRKVKTLNLLIVRSFTECSLPTLCVCVCFLKGKQSNCSHWPRSCLPVTHTQCLCVADGLSVQCAGALASCPAFFTHSLRRQELPQSLVSAPSAPRLSSQDLFPEPRPVVCASAHLPTPLSVLHRGVYRPSWLMAELDPQRHIPGCHCPHTSYFSVTAINCPDQCSCRAGRIYFGLLDLHHQHS